MSASRQSRTPHHDRMDEKLGESKETLAQFILWAREHWTVQAMTDLFVQGEVDRLLCGFADVSYEGYLHEKESVLLNERLREMLKELQ